MCEGHRPVRKDSPAFSIRKSLLLCGEGHIEGFILWILHVQNPALGATDGIPRDPRTALEAPEQGNRGGRSLWGFLVRGLCDASEYLFRDVEVLFCHALPLERLRHVTQRLLPTLGDPS